MNLDFLKAEAHAATEDTKNIRLINEGRMDIKGRPALLSTSAFEDLVTKVAGLDMKSINKLNEEKPGAGNRLVQTMVERNPQSVTLVSDNGRVNRVAPRNLRKNAVDGNAMHGIITTVLEKSENLILHNVSASPCNTRGSITLLDKRELEFRLPGEGFQVGYSIDWDMLQSSTVGEFFNRLVCSNGMIGKSVEGQQSFNQLSSPQQWYDAFLADDNFNRLERRYTYLVEKAIENTLSVREFNKVAAKIQNTFGMAGINQFVSETGGRDWMLDYARKGILMNELTEAQAANCPTSVNRFTAVNAATFMGRKSKGRLFKEASAIGGDLLTGRYDSDAWMPTAPHFEDVKCDIIGNEALGATKLAFGTN